MSSAWIRLFFSLPLLVVALATPLASAQPANIVEQLPDSARLWQNRSGVDGSGYSEYPGADIAYIDEGKGGWYYRDDNGLWRLFQQGPTLDLGNLPISNDAIQFEVFSGTALSGNAPADQYNLTLDGASGQLITADGFRFSPADYELLRGSNGAIGYYNIKTREWWLDNPFYGVTRQPKAPYQPLFLAQGTFPSPAEFGPDFDQQLTLDLDSLRYFNGNQVAGFHYSIATDYRRWNNESNMPCSSYSDYPGNDVLYVNGIWYEIINSTHYVPFFQGRYLGFEDDYGVDFLEQSLVAGEFLGDQGKLGQMGILLDGETGQLVDEQLNPLDPDDYRDPQQSVDCGLSYTLLLNDSLTLTGISAPTAFIASDRKVTLMQAVPLKQIANNPFNDRTLTLAINQARTVITPPVVVVPPPSTDTDTDTDIDTDTETDPVTDSDEETDTDTETEPETDEEVVDDSEETEGSCPLNASLSVSTSLPAESPLANPIGLGTTVSAGLLVSPSEEALQITPSSDLTAGTVSMTGNFDYVSGSPLGSIAENTSLTYLVIRNADAAEFEVTFTFTADIVFDDLGIIITSLSARQCTVGGPL